MCYGALSPLQTVYGSHLCLRAVGNPSLFQLRCIVLDKPIPTGDACQCPLVPRFRFWARLRPGVDMTSDVKSEVKRLVRLSALCCPRGDVIPWKSRSQEKRRLLLLLSVG